MTEQQQTRLPEPPLPTQSPGLSVHPHSALVLPRCRSPVDPPRSAPPSAEKVSPDPGVVRTARGSRDGGAPEGRCPRVGGQLTVSGAVLRRASSAFRERRPAPPGVLQAAAGGWEETQGGAKKVSSSGCRGSINPQGNMGVPVTGFNPAAFQPAGGDERCRNLRTRPGEAKGY